MKSVREGSCYVPGGVSGTFSSTPGTAGPWSTGAQHGGPPSGPLARAMEQRLGDGHLLARVSVDLLGPVPVGDLRVEVEVLRPGRRVSLLQATLYDVSAGRPCAEARGWALPRTEGGAGDGQSLPHSPDDGSERPLPESWSRGYVDHVEWRWIRVAVLEPGPAVVWIRSRVPLLPGEPLAGVPLLMTCVDSASGVSAALDPAEWSFMNTEITVHVLREPVGEWVCVSAETTLGSGSVGIATASVHDEKGLVARSTQALLVEPIPGGG